MNLFRSLREDAPDAWSRAFAAALVVATAFRIWLSFALPFTGDEAYFWYWGKNPDWGFYDHPPMIGWWMAALSGLSDAPAVQRLPALLGPIVIALATRALLAPMGPTVACGAATLIVLAPLNAVNVAVTTDAPLMVFAFLAMVAYLRALRTGRPIDHLFAGLLLGGALLSKYFAGLLALALGGHRLVSRAPGRGPGLALLVAGTLPAAALMIAWNQANCWPNVMFNLVNRHGNAGFEWWRPLLYVVTLAYVLGVPVLAWLLGDRPRSAAATEPAGRVRDAALAWMTALPFGLFAVLSLAKPIGLHWLACFVAPATWLFALRAGERGPAEAARRLRIAIRVAAAVAVVHWIAVIVLAALPTETFARWRSYPGLVLTKHGDELLAKLEPWRADLWAMEGYSPAVTLGHQDRVRRTSRDNDRILVFGPGSSHARHDDILTDWRAAAGRDVLIVLRAPPQPGEFDRFFERIERHEVVVRGATFHLVRGIGFRYEPYRDEVLDAVRARWYAVPTWLPTGPCYFCDRYFPDRACHR
ncbi:MAG: hypothetical protein RJA99_717 [Pseudomonadota bacterium]|jgi:hypothetical protein